MYKCKASKSRRLSVCSERTEREIGSLREGPYEVKEYTDQT